MDATLIAVACITAIPATIAATAAWRNGRKIDEVKVEVKTANDKTLAQLADAVETRRIEAIAEGERTQEEHDHLQAMGKGEQ